MALGSVERVLVLGIVVVIVAILGIAVWGATGNDPGVPAVAADGGVALGAPGVGSPRMPGAQSQFKNGAMPLPGAQPALPNAVAPATGTAPLAGGAVKPEVAPGAGASGTMPAPVSEIDRWKQVHEAEKAKRALDEGTAPAAPLAVAPVAPAPGLAGDAATPGSVPLKNNLNNMPGAVSATPAAKPGVGELPPLPTAKPVAVEPKTTTYTVANGDSLWKIAVKQYGDSNIQEHVDAIVAANPSVDPDRLKVGTKLNLPPKQTSVNRLPAKEQAKLLDNGLYAVKKGDTLSSIAKKQLGDSNRWREIYDLNREHIADPSMLFTGTQLRLPKS